MELVSQTVFVEIDGIILRYLVKGYDKRPIRLTLARQDGSCAVPEEKQICIHPNIPNMFFFEGLPARMYK